MNCGKKYFITLITGAIAITLSSCATPPTLPQTDSTSLPAAATHDMALTNQLKKATSIPHSQADATQPLITTGSKAASTPQSPKTVTVNIYQADNQCRTLIPKKVAVPAGSPVTATVGKVLQQADSADFELAGYRVNVNPQSRIATVDLRRAPDSQRQFVSLSICEQFALFGSLRKTLVTNSQWKIKDVRFTEQGQEIKL